MKKLAVVLFMSALSLAFAHTDPVPHSHAGPAIVYWPFILLTVALLLLAGFALWRSRKRRETR